MVSVSSKQPRWKGTGGEKAPEDENQFYQMK